MLQNKRKKCTLLQSMKNQYLTAWKVPWCQNLLKACLFSFLLFNKGHSNHFGVITTVFKPIGQLMLRLLSHNYSLRLTGPLPCSEQRGKCYKKEIKNHTGWSFFPYMSILGTTMAMENWDSIKNFNIYITNSLKINSMYE